FAVSSAAGKNVAVTSEFAPPAVEACNPSGFGDCTVGEKGDSFRVLRRSFSQSGQEFYLYTFRPVSDRLELESKLRITAFLSIPIGLLLSGLGGFFLIRRSLAPIREMSSQASGITSRNLHERLPVANPNDELGDLAQVFNGLLDRLDKAFEQQRRFMADASHELRTPLAIVRGESEVALFKDDRQAKDYKESLDIVHEESIRLTRIVDDLFTLARADSGNFSFVRQPIYVDEIVNECVRSIRTLAEKRDVSIDLSTEETSVSGDESLLRRMFLNLLDNAVKYNQEGGRISVDVRDRHVTISNTGPEIAPDQREAIFERFFRANVARSREAESSTSGAGLGLSISRWIAELHGASLNLTKSEHGENTFTVRFPR
ncbi:MAG: sensor histidine kinase, partial [Pyrinomonadaceae bacterium]